MTGTPTLARDATPADDPEGPGGPGNPGDPGQVTLSAAGAGRMPTAWVRARRRVDLEDPVIGWTASLGLTALALFLRLWHLGTPRVFQFDETYYAKDAFSLLHFGYAQDYITTANQQILGGYTSKLWTGSPEMIVHPEVGKWLIALGIKAFGMNPFGWRFASAVVGALMVLVMCRLLRRMTGSTLLGLVGGLLLMLDGLEFVLSRLALLDIFAGFFTLCAVSALVCDRDWFRARLAARTPEPGPDSGLTQVDPGWGPVRGLLWRPWLFVSGICWGLACGTKWDAVYPLAAFGILVVLWSAGARRSFGVRWSVARSALVDGVGAFAHLVLVALVVYVASWTGWLVHAQTYQDNLSSTQYTQFVRENGCTGTNPKDLQPNNVEDTSKKWPTAGEPQRHGLARVDQALHDLWYYHRDVYTFHTHFLNCAYHAYGSKPAGWLLLNRPVVTYYPDEVQPGTQGCQASEGSTCVREVILLGTPVLWWGGCLALLYAGVMWVAARDWRFGVAIVGTLSTWLPWLQYDTRPIFSFYAITTLPFLVMALTLGIGKLIGNHRTPSARRTLGVVVAGSFVVLVLLNFAWFYPVYTGELITKSQWFDRIWFQRWI